MRYKILLSYDGSSFSGWQRQDNAPSVQEQIEACLAVKLQTKVPVTGCGRTDAGVHASAYVMHFDSDIRLGNDFLFGMNRLLPESIAFRKIELASPDFHARFDATKRAYSYKIHAKKDPFKSSGSFFFPSIKKADKGKMDEAVAVLLRYSAFAPFCKSHSDVKTMACDLYKAEWIFDDGNDNYEFYIEANRFLRGMVRLIVGASIQLGLSKMNIAHLLDAMDKQTGLPKPWSVPAHGLYLNEISY